MNRRLHWVALGVLVVVAAGCGSSDTTTRGAADTTAKARAKSAEPVDAPTLLVLEASSGTYTGDERSGTVTLADVQPNSAWFTDRPARDGGTVPTDRALPRALQPNRDGAPNAAITVTRPKQQVMVVEVTEPAYDAAARTLTFRTGALSDAGAALEGWASRATGALPATFEDVSVFVDTVQQTCSIFLSIPTGAQLGEYATNSNYGGYVEPLTTPTPGGGWVNAFWQTGGAFWGCGGWVDWPIQYGGATVTLTIEWSNPETGSNSADCGFGPNDPPVLECTIVGGYGGDNPWFNYFVAPPGTPLPPPPDQ